MTLVLALANIDQCVYVSDRLLTDERGAPLVIPETKTTVLTLADSRLLCGFAGLARAGKFRTSEWILNALLDAAQPDHLAYGTVERFTAELTRRFQREDLKRVPKAHRGVSVLFTGYRDTLPPPNLITALVTNFQNFDTGRDEEPWDEFRVTYWSVGHRTAEPGEVTYVQRIGRWPAMEDPIDEDAARAALAERRSAKAITDLGVGLVRKAAGNPFAHGTIGRDIQSAILSGRRPLEISRGEFPVHLSYHPEGATQALYGVNQVISLPGFGVAMKQPMMRAEDDDAPPIAVRKVGRNKPCPCGSGKKYKKCCGLSRTP